MRIALCYTRASLEELVVMEIIKLTASPRNESGKGPASRLRRAGLIPAIAYGPKLAATRIAVSPKSLTSVLMSEHGKNSVVELAVEGQEPFNVMVRDYSYHPLTRQLLHADFLQVRLDESVDVEVPLRLTGKAKGIVQGGILQQIFRTLPVSSLPDRIPAVIEIDVTELAMGDAFKAGAVHVPEGVKIRLPDEQTVVVVAAPEKGGEEEAAPAAAAAAPAAAGKAAAGKAAAAPAAAAKAAAPAKAKK